MSIWIFSLSIPSGHWFTKCKTLYLQNYWQIATMRQAKLYLPLWISNWMEFRRNICGQFDMRQFFDLKTMSNCSFLHQKPLRIGLKQCVLFVYSIFLFVLSIAHSSFLLFRCNRSEGRVCQLLHRLQYPDPCSRGDLSSHLHTGTKVIHISAL